MEFFLSTLRAAETAAAHGMAVPLLCTVRCMQIKMICCMCEGPLMNLNDLPPCYLATCVETRDECKEREEEAAGGEMETIHE